MKTLNPFKLRKQLNYYITLCSRQALAVIRANEHISELIAQNFKQQQELEQLKAKAESLVKVLEFEKFNVRRYEEIEKVVTHGQGFNF
ncbi:hypothetical protein ACI3P7_08570 [Glaesserella parasuis]|uniref:hypothetical protein n=2 Tax=Glaesserella parasuis TaxID=738 RepID=UPI001365F4A1|nr:hypothetical protein [Glaesserella parasuis]